ncbi:TIGR03086 family metal-binding protein [Pseudonocardia broussonetiae]|uniref:TIGR03086 family protein n=1 Tax=Pseudonocardia broussonetiae TaxID=2736640 RepID=A0A6M6JPD8_9PSEU|nr:TIGR03086 family metal-binding protein [Pseudonocardia broussonetiae]QJY49874.1 TIGR03086 family protein [Pseudonocardia broussonetiae]
MATSSVPDLAPAADRVAGLLADVRDDHLDDPTPCAGIPVGALLSHLLMLCGAFRTGAEKGADPGPPPPEPPPLDPRWRTALSAELDALVRAWRAPGALEGRTSVGGVAMPAADVAVVALDELVLHGWDLARALGRPYDVEPASVRACLGFVSAVSVPEGVPGLFGPPVPVPSDAPELDRLLALSGRDPAWTPAGALR